MMANICTFMLSCFTITSNIKTIESTRNQITPLRLSTQLADECFVLTVNKLITFNKQSIRIKRTDVINLSNSALGTFSNYQLKLESRVKLERKAEDIKCSFGLIAKSKLLDLKDIFVKLKNGEPFVNDEKTVTRLKKEAGLVIHFLVWGNLKTGKWLWSYYLKIIAISQYEDNKRFIQENPFEEQQLQTGVSSFIEKCIAEKYLPKTAMESDLVSEKPEIYQNLFRKLRKTGWVSEVLHGSFSVLAPIDFLYLKQFWEDRSQFLFRQIAEVDVNWSNAKQRHELEVAITKEFVKNRTWISKPYERLEHHHFVIKIIDARFYCYFSVLLYIYEKQFSILHKHMMAYNKKLIDTVIEKALDLMAYKDDFMLNIISEFKYGVISDSTDIKYILAKSKTKAKEILKDLNCVSTNQIDLLSFNINEGQLSAEYLSRIIVDFQRFLSDLECVCLPFKYKVFLHFTDVIQSLATQQN